MAAAKAPAPYNLKYDPDKRKDLYDKFNAQQTGLAKIEQDKKDKLAAHQQLVKDLTPQLQAANKLTGKNKAAALAPLNKKINDSLAAYNSYVKNDIPKLTKEVNNAFAPFAKAYTAAHLVASHDDLFAFGFAFNSNAITARSRSFNFTHWGRRSVFHFRSHNITS